MLIWSLAGRFASPDATRKRSKRLTHAGHVSGDPNWNLWVTVPVLGFVEGALRLLAVPPANAVGLRLGPPYLARYVLRRCHRRMCCLCVVCMRTLYTKLDRLVSKSFTCLLIKTDQPKLSESSAQQAAMPCWHITTDITRRDSAPEIHLRKASDPRDCCLRQRAAVCVI